MRMPHYLVCSALVSAALLTGLIALKPDTGGLGGGGEPAGQGLFAKSGSGLYIVVLNDPPAASLAKKTPGGRLDERSDELRQNLDRLAEGRRRFFEAAESALGRPVVAQHEYRFALNGLALRLSSDEAAEVAKFPDVAGVFPNRVSEPASTPAGEVIQAPGVYNGFTSSGLPTRGEGIIVGFLDSGITPSHLSISDVDEDGYVHVNPFGAGNYVGVCDQQHSEHDPICNSKLIGAWSFVQDAPDARDRLGHGTLTSSLAVGSKQTASLTLSGQEVQVTSAGVAPRANLISYQVCDPGCPTYAILAGIDQAIADGVDIIALGPNGSTANPWTDPVTLALLTAADAGIFVSAPAGNSGPTSPAGYFAPWMATAGGTSNKTIYGNRAEVVAPANPPVGLTDMPSIQGSGFHLLEDLQEPVIWAEAVAESNELGCAPFASGIFEGAIALVRRGGCPFSHKLEHAKAAGAVAMAVINSQAGAPPVMGGLEGTTIPAVMIPDTVGSVLVQHLESLPIGDVVLKITQALQPLDVSQYQDILYDLSSAGFGSLDLLAPTWTAPAVGAIAASSSLQEEYTLMSGTSVSMALSAGSAALLRSLHPDWSPLELRSVLAGSADYDTVILRDGLTPATPFHQGSGRLNLVKAARAGLVMNETTANFFDADPDQGGDPRTLNMPSIVDSTCMESCHFTRSVKSVLPVPVDYTVHVDAPAGVSIHVSPQAFTLAPGEEQQLMFEVNVGDTNAGSWSFGRVRLDSPVVNDFVELGESYGHVDSWTVRTHDLSSYHDREVCFAFVYRGSDAHDYRIDDVVVTNIPKQLLSESFSGEAFPPPGWRRYQFGQKPHLGWRRDVSSFSSAPSSARHHWTPPDRHDDGWLITPQVRLGNSPSITYKDRTDYANFYDYSGVWISTGSCEVFSVSTFHLPVAVRRVLPPGPHMVVEPGELDEVLQPDENTEVTLTVRNEGDADLEWFVGSDEGCDHPSTVTWLSLVPEHGQTAPGQETAITVTVGSHGLSPGIYQATLCLGSNAPLAPLEQVAVSLEVVPGAASPQTSAISALPNWLIADGESVAVISVSLRDASGNDLDAGGDEVLIWTRAGQVGDVVDNDDGTYVATYTAPVHTGVATIEASVNGVDLVQSVDIELRPGAACVLTSTMSTDDDSLVADGASTTTVTIALNDALGNPLESGGDEVLMFVSTGDLGPVVDNQDGSYQAVFTAPTVTGMASVSAIIAGEQMQQSLDISLLPGNSSPVTTAISADPVELTADGFSTATILVSVFDDHGNARGMGGDAVDLHVTLGSISVVIDRGDGTYEATFTAPTTAGIASLGARLNGVMIDATVELKIVPGDVSPDATTIVVDQQSLPADGESTAMVTVHVRDAHDNPRAGAQDEVLLETTLGSIEPAHHTADGVYQSLLTAAAEAGEAVITGWVNGQQVVGTATVTFTEIIEPRLDLVVVSSPKDPWTAGDAFTVLVEVRDELGDKVIGHSGAATIDVASGPAGAQLKGTKSVSISNGLAAFALTIEKAGDYVLEVSSDGLTAGFTETITIVAAAASRLAVTAAPSGSLRAGTPFLVTCGVTDDFENAVAPELDAIVADIASGPTGARLTGALEVAPSNGSATFALAVDRAGTYVLEFQSQGLMSVTTDPFEVADQDEPGDDEPGDDEPGDDEPGDDEPGDDEPGDDEPGDDEPGDDEPGDDSPDEGRVPDSGCGCAASGGGGSSAWLLPLMLLALMTRSSVYRTSRTGH